ncbi:MAG: matrixin family metalloprotease [Planctomycetota bacterium]|jgi:hypothetical protein
MNLVAMKCFDSMRARRDIRGLSLVAMLSVLLIICTGGCGTNVGGGTSQQVTIDGNRDPSATSALGKTSGEPNDSFADPIVAVFDSIGVARLQGMVETSGDLDVFLLGSVSAGDRVTVDADTAGSSLDVAVGVFDAEHRLVAENDDRELTVWDSYTEFIARHSGDRYYLVVTGSAFAVSGQGTGSYEVDVTITRGLAVPAPVEQLLVLDFDGGKVDSPGLGSVAIVAFDAAAISPVYRGQTEAFKQEILAAIEQNFERFDVVVQTSDDPPPPSGVEFSTVFFGGFSHDAFGMAESVDLYNEDFCDDAIIYTESFEPRVFTFVPTVAEMGVAIGNVAAHEAGHLLGLNHVDDDRALMDDRSPADVFVTDQEFMEASLSSDIMLIGTQDAVLLLSETVGLLEIVGWRLPID